MGALMNFVPKVESIIGYCFTDNDYIFGGVKYQIYNLIPKYDWVEDDLWSTNTIHNLLLYTGARYLLSIAKIKKNNDNEYTHQCPEAFLRAGIAQQARCGHAGTSQKGA